MSWKDDFKKTDSKWESWPKVGEEKTYEISKIEKVTDSKYNFTRKENITLPDGTEVKVDKNLGYAYVFTLKNGKKVTLSRWPLAYALQKAGVDDGMKVRVAHPKEGEWKITVETEEWQG